MRSTSTPARPFLSLASFPSLRALLRKPIIKKTDDVPLILLLQSPLSYVFSDPFFSPKKRGGARGGGRGGGRGLWGLLGYS